MPEDRKFIGFDAYQKAMDCLKPGDVAIFATPPAFRWVHFSYAIEKGLNVFMEKPVTVDGPTHPQDARAGRGVGQEEPQGRRGPDVSATAGPGRSCTSGSKTGEIGDIIALRAYRMHGPLGRLSRPQADGHERAALPDPAFPQLPVGQRRRLQRLYIHHIDECCWMKDAWPVKAQAIGGRHYRGDCVDQNFDNYSVEYTFADGTKLFFYGRSMDGCYERIRQLRPRHQGLGRHLHCRATRRQVPHLQGPEHRRRTTSLWAFPQPEPNPYQLEWDDLIDAIRQDKPYNEVKRGAEASLVTSMGRMAAHTGQIITYDQMLNCPHEFAPDVDKLTMDSPAPLAGRPRRQVSRAAAGHHQEAGVLRRPS